MKKYGFYLDRKFTIWEREKFEIEAESKEDAISQIKNKFSEEGNGFYTEGEAETLYDTMEFIFPEENQASTMEIFDNETHKIILTNWEDH